MKILAFDTSTEQMSVALADGERLWQHQGPGGAQASATLIPAILALLAQAGLRLPDLDFIAFGRGPGSFTGLRTACAVAQGLALGTNLPLLPVDSLLAIAEQARAQLGARRVVAMLDARMDEIYLARYDFDCNKPLYEAAVELIRPESVEIAPGWTAAGNVFQPYAGRLPAGASVLETVPQASAMLRLAPAMVTAGQTLPADLALPLYVRDKVASTTEERALARAAAEATAAA